MYPLPPPPVVQVDPELPSPNVSRHALAHFMRAVEVHIPGIIEETLAALEDEALAAEVRRLRTPREAESIARVRAAATAWVKHVRLVTLAAVRPKVKPLKKVKKVKRRA